MNKKELEKRLSAIEAKIIKLESQELSTKPEIKWTKIGNLLWSECFGEMDWDKAKAKCEELGGRLPTRIELIDLFDNHYAELQELPDSGYAFWSSTEDYSGATYAWYVHLYSSYMNNINKTSRYYVRCVRRRPGWI